MRLLYSFFLILSCLYSLAGSPAIKYDPGKHSLNKLPGIITLDLKKDFGALGNGKLNLTPNKNSTQDHAAFEKATAFINERGGHVRLIIPYGTYIIGKQVFNEGKINHHARSGWGEYASYDGFDLMLLMNVRNVTIEGKTSFSNKKTALLYRSGLRFGLFKTTNGETSDSKLLNEKSNIYYDKNSNQRAHIGNAFTLYKCSNVTVSNIEIDGNAASFFLGGKYGRGANPYENYHSGIYIMSSETIKILQLDIKNMGLDGIVIKDNSENLAVSNDIEITNCKVKRNGRNGLSWLSGVGVTIKNCDFSEMGTGRISTEPCAGIDIEPETLLKNGGPSNGTFINCTVKDNKWLALAGGIAVLNGKQARSNTIQFRKCIFTGSKNSVTDIESDGFRFDSCEFYGQLYLRNNSDLPAAATQFNFCKFSNMYQGKKMKGSFLIVNVAAKRTKFFNCSFTSYNERIFNMDNTGFLCGDYTSYPLYENCIFKCYINKMTDGWVNTSGLGSKTAFKNSTFYYNEQYPFLTDTYSGNMCAQDLGGNKYIPLDKKDIPNNK